MPKPDKTDHGKRPNTISISGNPDLLKRIDDWRKSQDELGPRSEAVKQLLDEALTAAGFPATVKEDDEGEETSQSTTTQVF